jgi:hypothetical protein
LLACLQLGRPFPFFAAVTTGLFAYHAGAGPFGTITTGLIAGAATLAIGQFVFAIIRSPLPKALITVAFALPAAVAGYHLMLGLSTIGMASDLWRHVFAVLGAIVVGSTAWARFMAHPSKKPERCRVLSAAKLTQPDNCYPEAATIWLAGLLSAR